VMVQGVVFVGLFLVVVVVEVGWGGGGGEEGVTVGVA